MLQRQLVCAASGLMFSLLATQSHAIDVAVTLDPPAIVPGETSRLEIVVATDSSSDVQVSFEVPANIRPFGSEFTDAPNNDLVSTVCIEVGEPFVCEPGDVLQLTLTDPDVTQVYRVDIPVTFEPVVAPGTTAQWIVDATQGGDEVQSDAVMTAISAPVATLSLDPRESLKSVASRTPPVYELRFANPGTATIDAVQIAVPLSDDVEIIPLDGGVRTPENITWTVGELAPGANGVVRFEAYPLANGFGPPVATIEAQLTGSIADQPIMVSTQETVAEIDGDIARLELDVQPLPAAPGDTVEVTLNLWQPFEAPAPAQFFSWIVFPEGIAPIHPSRIPGLAGDVCAFSGATDLCDPGDILLFNPFDMNERRFGVVAFNATIDANAAPGTMIDWLAGTIDNQDRMVWIERSLPVVAGPQLSLAVDSFNLSRLQDMPGLGGDPMEYSVHIGNPFDTQLDEVVIEATIESGHDVISARDATLQDDTRVVWEPFFLGPGQTLTRRLVLNKPSISLESTPLIRTNFVLTGLLNGVPYRREFRRVHASTLGPLAGTDLPTLLISTTPLAPNQSARLNVAFEFGFASDNAALEIQLPDDIAPVPLSQVVGPIDFAASCGAITTPDICEGGESLFPAFGPNALDAQISMPIQPTVDAGEMITVSALLQTANFQVPLEHATRSLLVNDQPEISFAIEQPTNNVDTDTDVIYTLLHGRPGLNSDADDLVAFLPGTMLFVSATGNGQFDPTSRTVRWTDQSVDEGGIARQQLRLKSIDSSGVAPISARLGVFGPLNDIELTAETSATIGADSPLTLALHIVENKTEFDDALEVTIDLANTSNNGLAAGQLAVRVPIGLAPIEETLIGEASFDATASCGPATPDVCEPGDTLHWAPGSLGPGARTSVSFPANIEDTTAPAGTLIPLAASATQFGHNGRLAERVARIQNSGITLSAELDKNTILPGQTAHLTWYAALEAGSQPADQFVRVVLPSSVSFVSASENGFYEPTTRTVDWFDSLMPGQVIRGELTLTANTDAPAGELVDLVVDNAGFFTTSQRPMAASQALGIGTPEALALDVTFEPAVASPGDSVSVTMSVSNASGSEISDGQLTWRFPVGFDFELPAELSPLLQATACEALEIAALCEWGELIRLDLAPLAPGETADYVFDAVVTAGATDGSLIPLMAGVTSPGSNNVWQPHTLPVSTMPDSDYDSIPDAQDNCINQPNSDQRDSNGDGFGNVCDADLNNDCIVRIEDLGLFRIAFFSSDEDADFNGDGVVNFSDLGILRTQFFESPGPSGLVQCP